MALKDDHYTYRVTWSEEGPGVCWPVRRLPNFELLGKGPESVLKGVRKPVAEFVVDGGC